MKGVMYILFCANGRFYTGSTINLRRRVMEHKAGVGSNYTRDRLPVRLVYYEEYYSIFLAYKRERQIHSWSHGKKLSLMKKDIALIEKYEECQNSSISNTKKITYSNFGRIKVWRDEKFLEL